jgi:hypothetical protein
MVPFSSSDCSKCNPFLRNICQKFKKSTIFKPTFERSAALLAIYATISYPTGVIRVTNSL